MSDSKQEVNSQKEALKYHIEKNLGWSVRGMMILLFLVMIALAVASIVLISVYVFILIKGGDVKQIGATIAAVVGWALVAVQNFTNKK